MMHACMHPSRQTDIHTYMVNVVKCVNVYNVASPLWLSWAPRTCVVQRPSAAKPPGGATWSAASPCDVCCCTWRRVGPESHGDGVLRSWVGLILGANILAGDVFPVFSFFLIWDDLDLFGKDEHFCRGAGWIYSRLSGLSLQGYGQMWVDEA